MAVICIKLKCVCRVRFQCQVTAEPEPSLTWFYNDQPLTSSSRIQLTFDKTTTTLTILSATVQDTGEYTCKATNTLGEATTKTFLRVRRMYPSVISSINFKWDPAISPGHIPRTSSPDNSPYGCSPAFFCIHRTFPPECLK